MVAVRPTFHLPALLAKQAANIDHISGGRISLNVVSSWWEEEAQRYGVPFDSHDTRYARTSEWLDVVCGAWTGKEFSFHGSYYQVDRALVAPGPVSRPHPVLYAGGESEAAKDLIARKCDAYVMHGDPPEQIAQRIADLSARRAGMQLPPLRFGVSGYLIVRPTEREVRQEIARITDVKADAAGFANYQQWLAGTQLEQAMRLAEYSVSNRGLRSGLVGTPEQVLEQIERFRVAGVDLLLLQCSPQLEEMERISQEVITPYRRMHPRPGAAHEQVA
jgi:FMNH2-dependent dimethyl sulfone monooxygenase